MPSVQGRLPLRTCQQNTPGGRFPRMITSKDDEPDSNPILIQSTLIWKLWTSRDVLLFLADLVMFIGNSMDLF